MKKKGNKKMPIPRLEVIDSPTPSLHLCLCAMQLFCCLWVLGIIVGSNSNTCKCVQVIWLLKNKDVYRDGVISNFLSRYRNLLVPLFFMT